MVTVFEDLSKSIIFCVLDSQIDLLKKKAIMSECDRIYRGGKKYMKGDLQDYLEY